MKRSRLRALGVTLSAVVGLAIATTARGDDRAVAEAILLPVGTTRLTRA